MKVDFFGREILPVFMCYKSGHDGPYKHDIDLFRGLGCKACLKKAFPDHDWENPGRLIATEMAQQQRRVSKAQFLNRRSDLCIPNKRRDPVQ